MLKKIAIIFFVFSSLYQLSEVEAANPSNFEHIECHAPLKGALAKICQLPEAQSLIQKVQREGNIRIQEHNASLVKQFGACWNPIQRSIYLAKGITEGQKIGFLIFELHNAAASSQLQFLEHLAKQKIIDKDTYVKAVEHVEYENSIKASKITSKGIQLNIFPKDAFLPTYRNFQEHYHFQKLGGHSAALEKQYYKMLSTSKI